MSDTESRLQRIRDYHERTTHRLNAYARGPETLDWEQQPNPFRHFDGCPTLPLPLLAAENPVSWRQLHQAELPSREATLENLAALLQLSMGLSAWKEYGPSRWSLRQNPSSGNLHPTETYVIARNIAGLDAGVYHYAVETHALQQRCASSPLESTTPTLLLGLSSIAWREAWKYGERAYRYVQLDVGHALGAIRYSAALLGWRCHLLNLDDARIATLLGLDREADFKNAERETPDLILHIDMQPHKASATPELAHADASDRWQGRANALGGEPHLHWQVIDEVEQACRQTAAWHGNLNTAAAVNLETPCELPAQGLIQRRRSAQAFDANTRVSFETLLPMLHGLSESAALPLDLWPLPPRIHPVLFVHRVDGLKPGLYALPRNAAALALLQSSLSSEFIWEKIPSTPALPLYGLIYANAGNAARVLSCHQAIASDSVMALSLLAEFNHALQSDPAEYRRLHWEAGLLGQQLYLQAEALDLQGTGIGCFFDDSLHQTLGIEDTRLRVVYHFTIGKGVFDSRIRSLQPY